MAVPSSKAAGFITVVNVLREECDPADFARYAAALPAATAALVEVAPMAIAWLPIDHFYALVDTAQAVLFGGKDERVVAVGHRSIGRDVGTLYRAFVRLASPEYVMSRTAQLWGAYNRDHGTVTVVMRSPTAADVTYAGIPPRAPAAFWAFQRGALRAVLEATGVRNVSTELIPPAAAGAPTTIRVAGVRPG